MELTKDIYLNQISIGSIFDELDKICKVYDLTLDIRLFLYKLKLKRTVKRLRRKNQKIINNLYRSDFNTIQDFEEVCIEVLQSLEKQAQKCRACDFKKCKTIFFNVIYNPLVTVFKNSLDKINLTYHYDANKIFASDEEYNENNETLKVFSDLWSDETMSKEDKESVFNNNVKLKDA